jgi:FtsH-binding integral membrane protein
MANLDNRPRFGANVAQGVEGVIDAGLRAHMVRVYNYMMSGLVLTGITSYATYLMAFDTVNGQLVMTSLGMALFGSPLIWVLMLAPLGLVFFLSFRINKMSVSAAQTTFWVYASLLGISLATIFVTYTMTSITQVFFITAATFGSMSLYGYTTNRDLTSLGSFLFMGLIGVIIAMVVNMFLQSSALGFAISVLGVLIFVGLTAYDTQKIKEEYYAGDGEVVAGRKAIIGALRLYLDFINLFLMMLRLFGNRS